MIYASTFLSHSSDDKLLVEKVAHELGRRGVIAWLDKNELQSGESLSLALHEAVQRQATVTVFLSEAAIKSRWVEDELAAALQKHDALHESASIIPIYLGDPVSLVSSHPLLRTRWLHPDGNRVDRLGINIQSPYVST
jgi:translation elongation factor EF-Ts